MTAKTKPVQLDPETHERVVEFYYQSRSRSYGEAVRRAIDIALQDSSFRAEA